MKDFAFVECLFTLDEYREELCKLTELGDDFRLINCSPEYEEGEAGLRFDYMRVSGKINTMVASLIKLQNPTLAGKMRISYISEELKDKYRR